MARLSHRLLRAGCWLALAWLLLAALPARAAVPHLELEIELDPATRRLQASARLTSERVPDFALHPQLALARVGMDGKAVPLASLQRLAPAPGEHRFTIEYAGTLPPLPERTQPSSANPASLYAAAEGSYLAPEAGWYPDPGVPFTYTVKLRLPAGQKGLVPGRQVRANETGGHWIAEYAFAHPADGIWLMAGPYRVAQQAATLEDGSVVNVRTWFHPELAELASGYLQDSARYLQRYSRAIGAYPFGDFSVVSSPLPHGLGIPSLTYLGREVLRLPFIRATSLGHEVLHNWWGNGVRPDWRSGNWSEGLTTFGADYAFREDQGADPARTMRLEWLRDLLAVAPADETALTGFTARSHGISSVIGYAKPAMLFVMLRDEIGPAAFEQGLRVFWQQHRFRTAAWKDLERAFSQASGRDLARFFAQWTQRAASPTLALAPATPGRFRVLQQGEPFDLLVPLRVQVASGTTRDIAVRVSERETLVDLAARGVPEAVSVALDPELRLWRRLDPATVPAILRETFIAPRAQLHVAASGAEWSAAATALAERTLDAQPVPVAADALLASAQEPALVAGDRAGITRVLAQLGLGAVPEAVAQEGTGRVWAARAASGKPLVFVLADTPAALAAMQRALPHYGRQSWLVFRDTRVVAQGAWPPEVAPLKLH
ncbi:MAG TPA: M1 family aminopeptidase [Ramlibacter sp.]|uniref:M1 family metallopeptidase n=1 Tax=Ramlibacter sp. TaxID=1917967 RepID=UPI002D7EDB5E|nr:M1 family aminopeptidase [Ramlibacter sp.]HET8745947.1 M1 family aminopeptidase [Ramlibacter sp.]